MFLSLLFIISQIAIGIVIIDFFDKERFFSVLERILSIIIIGSTASAFLVLGLALLFKSLTLAIIIEMATSFILFVYFKKWQTLKIHFNFKDIFTKKNLWLVPLLLILAVYWALIFFVVLFYSSHGTLQAYISGWGDSAVHIDMIQRMAVAQPFLIDNPIMAGTHLPYPFLINFLSAIFLKLGSSLLTAFRLPLLIYGTSALLLIFAVALRILKSKSFAVLALFLILFGSGWGITSFFHDITIDIQTHGITHVVQFLKNPPHEYTFTQNMFTGKNPEKSYNDNISWMVPIAIFLTHQRSFSLGLALFLLILLGILAYGHSPNFWKFGILAGLIPLSHAHSFLALFLLMAVLFWFYLKGWKPWLLFAIICATIALPQLLYFKSGPKMFSYSPKLWFGWVNCSHSISWFFCDPTQPSANPFIFWSKNFGIVFLAWIIVIFLTLFFIFLKKKMAHINIHISFIVGSVALFLLGNLFSFQPFPFDNDKLIFYWWILAILFCTSPLLMWLWQKQRIGKTIVIVLVIFGSLAGIVDITARFLGIQNSSYGYSDSDKDKAAVGLWVKNNTPANALFLTAPNIDPAPLFLAGRPVYLGYEGWLWTWGLDYQKNRSNMITILQGDMHLACQEKIDYILIDSDLQNQFSSMKEDQLLSSGIVVYQNNNNYIIKTPCQ